MSEKCGKCGVPFQSTEIVARCTDCKSNYHPACTRLGSVQNFTKGKRSNWRCDSCREDTASVRSTEDNSEDKHVILAALSAMKNEIIASMDSKISDMRGSIDSLTAEFKTLNSQFITLEQSQVELDRRCCVLERVADNTTDEVRQLRQRLLDLEQHSRCANIEIQGMPHTHHEDIYALLKELAAVLGVAYAREDVSIAHRLRLFSKRSAHPPIIVQFLSRSVKQSWISAARSRRGLTAKEVSTGLPATPVYINEHLTANNKQLLGRARRLLREKKLHFAAYVNGKVLVKRRDGDEAQRVLFSEDLDTFDTK